MEELDNYENWPHNMWVEGAGGNEHLRHQIRGLKRLCASQMEEEDGEKPPPEIKLRSKFSETYDEDKVSELSQYAVGMVMKHRRYDYYCVIYGWDAKCTASRVSQIKTRDRIFMLFLTQNMSYQ